MATDYTLISFSLLAILCYMVYVLARKRRSALKQPQLLTLTLLCCLFGALFCFAFVGFKFPLNTNDCEVFGSFIQFLFFSTISWSNCIAICIYRGLTHPRALSKSIQIYIRYCFYAFSLPLASVFSTLLFSNSNMLSSQHKVLKGSCFIADPKARYAMFLGPSYLLAASNIVIAAIVLYKVDNDNILRPAKDIKTLKHYAQLCIKVTLCFGIGWALLNIATIHVKIWMVFQLFLEAKGVLAVILVLNWKSFNKNTTRAPKLAHQTSNVVLYY